MILIDLLRVGTGTIRAATTFVPTDTATAKLRGGARRTQQNDNAELGGGGPTNGMSCEVHHLSRPSFKMRLMGCLQITMTQRPRGYVQPPI